MASPTTTALLLLSVIVGVLAISATARPCKTIFFITSSSYYPSGDQHLRNPNFALQNPSNSPRFTFFITEIHQFHRTRSFSRPIFTDHAVESSSEDAVSSKPYYSSASSSIRDRTMDIMSIVGALLFGVGCGALTAGTMYLIWSLFSNRRMDFTSDEDEDEFSDVEDDVTPNKNGYAAIPTAVKDVPPTADEVEAMK
ncbi:hypothetical protein R6Q59_000214 [Mikania micrantha]|uniref:Legume lectin domain-containing protein n=1 Tax=Mikania micrantha TaxID=192012 RepID=A0A5N6MMT8_9ASTR|nr:hypothetical protein E3N88_29837 [Mikania micrantha]